MQERHRGRVQRARECNAGRWIQDRCSRGVNYLLREVHIKDTRLVEIQGVGDVACLESEKVWMKLFAGNLALVSKKKEEE